MNAGGQPPPSERRGGETIFGLPGGARLTRWVLVIEAVGVGVAGGMLLMLALVSAIAGDPLFALVLVGAGSLLGPVGALAWLLKSKLIQRLDRWRVLTVVIEGTLGVLGMPMIAFADFATRTAGTSSMGTDGPFADGVVGMTGLLGEVFVIGAVITVAGQAWDVARLLQSGMR